ncbi:MAG TPA: PKD domain-containing protein [Trebonia sp.]
MTRNRARRLIRRVSAPGLTGLALIFAVGAGPMAAAANASPVSASTASAQAAVTPAKASPAKASAAKAAPASTTASALKQAFETGQKIPGSAIGGISADTLHTGSANGHQWAVASFEPAKSVTEQQAVAFQDGAASGVFEETAGVWHLVRSGSNACGTGLPASLKTAWHITAPASVCATSAASQDAAAQRALAALPASARAAASTAPASTASAAPKASVSAADPADFGQAIAAIALSQVGHTGSPATDSFNVDCDPYSTMVAGFSGDSDGCGYDSTYNVTDENETWCSDFAKWVWEKAGITDDLDTINAGAVSYYQWATAHGQSPEPDTGTPQAGDSVLFFSPGEFPSFADHVGIVTAVNADGSINMVNGDFGGGGETIKVEYDQDITDLSTFAASVENPGEQWVLVSPPTTAQAPAPAGKITGPTTAVAGTTGEFHATGAVSGSNVSGYYWTFGDNRTTNASGPDVEHAFSEPGTYTVAVTITSAAGTAVTLHQNVHVVAASASVISAPDDGIWYDPLPVEQYTFTRSGSTLEQNAWNGGSWLQTTVPGAPAATGTITSLAYPDSANDDNMTAHAFYRAAGGSLAETYQTSSGWVTKDLPGSPAAGAAIVATNTTAVSADPEVFFIDTAGDLEETAVSGGTWHTAPVLRGGPAVNAASLSLADTTSGPEIFAVGPAGTIRVFSQSGGAWAQRGLPAKTSGSSVSAVTTPDGSPAVLFTDNGRLAEATQSGASPAGKWNTATVPGSPKAGTSLAATTYLLPSQIPATPGDFANPYGTLTDSNNTEPFGVEAFYLTASGAPAASYDDGTGWKTVALPSVSGATGIAGATAFPFEEEPSNLFLTGANGGLYEETTGARSGDPSGGTWTSEELPTAPSTWANRVILYAADSSDATIAQEAAAAAGLPASSVTTSFSAAWADTLDGGTYLVYAVGSPAVRALYSNVCNWSNPSALAGPGTPFSYEVGQWDAPIGADYYVDATSDTDADTLALATDDAYYALNGTLPSGVTSAPAAVGSSDVCAGSPS